MAQKIELDDISIEVVLKDIKNVHLSVYPPHGRVKISAPRRMKLETIRVFAISRLAWIKEQQRKLREQQRETPREYLDRESHYLWGQRYLLKVVEADGVPSVEAKHSQIILQVRPGSGKVKRETLIEDWYREQVKAAVPELIARWEPVMNVKVGKVFVQRMRTRWGSCNPRTRSIRLNTDLAKKPRECLEYIVVHELAHLLVPTHGERFVALMEQYMPKWRLYRDQLNQLPVRHEEWVY